MPEYKIIKYFAKAVILSVGLIIANCNPHTYYLQRASVLSGRKIPTITTDVPENRMFDVEIYGSFSGDRAAEFTSGRHTDYVSSDMTFDHECASDSNCNDSLINNIPYTWGNTNWHTNQWNTKMQLSISPIIRDDGNGFRRLKVLTSAQMSRFEGDYFFNFNLGTVLSFSNRRVGFHPKIIIGYSKIDADYEVLKSTRRTHTPLFGDPYYTYTWSDPEYGKENSYQPYLETGITFEMLLNRKSTLFCDIGMTVQSLFDYSMKDVAEAIYYELSPGFKINLSNSTTLLSGVSLAYNPEMFKQLPPHFFFKIQNSFGPSLRK